MMSKLHPMYTELKERQERLLTRKNEKSDFYNGIYDRWVHPVLTRESVPLEWRYDLNPETNPFFQERLGVNAVFNAGAVELNGKYYLVARIEGNDRKSFFGVAESGSGVDGFRFWEKPVELPDTCPEETNVYDMRLTKHEDGWIYGIFCSESKDTRSADLSAAVAADQGPEALGAAAELKNAAQPPAAERGPAPGVRPGEIRLLYPAHGRFYRDRFRRRHRVRPLRGHHPSGGR